MNKVYIMAMLAALLFACQQQEEVPKAWVFQKTIPLDGVNPIGLAQVDGSLWLADGDHNRLVRISEQGKIVSVVDSLQRPMHIDASEGVLYIPLYGTDEILKYNPNAPRDVDESGDLDDANDPDDAKNPIHPVDPINSQRQNSEWSLPNDSLDAPAGVSVFGQEKAIADFYNNRILYNNGTDWMSFGTEGKAEGEFYYPTDVQITEKNIWVADAYNHRVQVFDKRGNFVKMIGQQQKMNAATGIFVSGNEVFVTDFENDRVLVFDVDGNLNQEIKENIEKPTDILLWNNILYVLNYRKGSIAKFAWGEKSKPISAGAADASSAFKTARRLEPASERKPTPESQYPANG